MGDRERGPGPQESEVRRAPSHSTWHASALGWPLLALLSLRNPGSPLSVLLIVGALAFFVLFLWTIYKTEQSLNREGESLFRPWRVRSPVRHARRIDGVLATSIRRLKSGEDEEEVLATLSLHVARELGKEARRHYDRAVARLEEASRRDWVFDAERRRSALEEAEKELWMTRAEYLREMLA